MSTRDLMPSVNTPIPADKKITYAFFVRSVWALSNTNLPVKDFEAEFGPSLEKMFAPVYMPLFNGRVRQN